MELHINQIAHNQIAHNKIAHHQLSHHEIAHNQIARIRITFRYTYSMIFSLQNEKSNLTV